jgi:sodium/bile acid cotransporter 7
MCFPLRGGETLDAGVGRASLGGVAKTRQTVTWSSLWRKHGFLLGLVLAVVAGFAFPQGGRADALLPPSLVSQAGIALILWMQGLSLPLREVRKGAGNWKLHSLVQITTFLVFPLAGWLIDLTLPLVWPAVPPGLRHGFLYLCVLPSTISTSVVFTAAARGNTSGALFNAALSNVAGVLLTPMLVHALIWRGVDGGAGDFLPLLGKICLLTLLPFGVGMILRPWIWGKLEAHKAWVGRISNGVILYIVYVAFCDSVTSGVWELHGWRVILPAVMLVLLLFAVMSWVVLAFCSWVHLARADRIAAYFCGVKKTLAMGVPLAALIFGPEADLSLILLPVMIYHPVQLLVNGAMASRWGAEGEIR